MSVLHLVRHGQARFGTADYDRLTATGVEQCVVLARHWLSLSRPPPEVFSGTLRRQRLSAEAFATEVAGPGVAAPPVRLVDGLEEYDHRALLIEYGGLCGRAVDVSGLETDPKQLHRHLENALRAWVDGKLAGPEPFAVFRDRCARALESVMEQVGRGVTGVVFGSAGSLAAAMQPILGLDDWDLMRLKLNFYNTGVSRVLFSTHARVVETINSIAHLEQPAAMHLITHR